MRSRNFRNAVPTLFKLIRLARHACTHAHRSHHAPRLTHDDTLVLRKATRTGNVLIFGEAEITSERLWCRVNLIIVFVVIRPV